MPREVDAGVGQREQRDDDEAAPRVEDVLDARRDAGGHAQPRGHAHHADDAGPGDAGRVAHRQHQRAGDVVGDAEHEQEELQ